MDSKGTGNQWAEKVVIKKMVQVQSTWKKNKIKT